MEAEGVKVGPTAGHYMDRDVAERARTAIAEAGNLEVRTVSSGSSSRAPLAPYITSTLQQDASRYLGFSAAKTMNCAQTLFEGTRSLHAAGCSVSEYIVLFGL